MGNSPETSIIVIDKVLSFLSENIWVIFLLVFIVVFREPLSSLFKRIISFDFSFGDAKGGIKATVPESQEVKHEELIAVEKKEPEENKTEEEKLKEEGDKENWFSEMHLAFLSKEYEKAKEIFEEYFKNETDNDKKIQNETFYLYFLYTKAGDKSALDRLKRIIETSENEKQKNNAIVWLAICYKFSKNYDEAEKLLTNAIEQTTDEEEKTNLIVYLAGTLKNNNLLDRAVLLVESRLKSATTKKEKSDLYKSISEIEKERGNEQISALALEKVIELNPDDKEILFNGAYAQSQSNLEYLSAYNYDTLVALDPDHSTALNNLGVAANNIEIPTRAVEFYNKSVGKGNTLAMANLAQLYLNNGFLEDAKKIIKIAQTQEEPHENVSHVITGIHTKEDNEKKRWDDALKKGNEYRKFIRQYTSAYFSEGVKPATYEGTWYLSNNTKVEIKVKKNQLFAEWQSEPTGLSSSRLNCTLSGTVHNNSALITYKSEPIDKKAAVGLLSGLNSVTYDCFAYVHPDNNEIIIKSKDPKKTFSINLYKEVT